MSNPFIADDSGRVPNHIAGRQSELSNISRIATVEEDCRKKNYLVTGLRGVGKSVLLNKLKIELEQNDWACSVMTVFEGRGRRTKDLIGLMIENIANTLNKITSEPNKNYILDFRKIYTETPGSLEARTQAVILYALRELRGYGKKGLMIGFDEAQFIVDNKSIDEFPRSILLSILQSVQSSGENFFYAFSGLPNLLTSLQESKPNIERAFGYYEKLNNLSDTDSQDLIKGTLDEGTEYSFADELINHIVKICSGYPYFLQYYCSKLIDEYIATAKQNFSLEDFTSIEEKLTEHLDHIFFDSRFEVLSDSDQSYFEVTLKLEKPFYPKDLLAKYNEIYPSDQKSQVAIRQAIFRLVQKGLLLKKANNGYEYTIPMIDEYVKRKEMRRSIDFL